MRLAVLSHGRDGFQLNVDHVPFWAWTLSEATEWTFHGVCAATGHRICGPPEWTFHVGVGTDPFPDPELRQPHRWSVGQALCWWSQHSGYAFAWKRTKTELKIPLTNEQAAEIDSQWVAQALEMYDDTTDLGVSADASRWRPERAGQ